MKKLNEVDWRFLNKYTSPKAMGDLNVFLEKLPQNADKAMLIVSGVVWMGVAALGLYTTVKMQEFSEMSVKKEEAQALLPIVPQIKDSPVPNKELKAFVDELSEIYKGLEIRANSSDIVIQARSTSQFGQFREAMGHVQNGGFGWNVSVDKLCVGKECRQFPLSASLKINKVSVEKVPVAE